VLVAIRGLQVVFRFVLDNPLAWVLEVSVILMVRATMLPDYLGVRRNSHLSADFLGVWMKRVTRWAPDALTVLCAWSSSRSTGGPAWT
jgi:TRAP-type C4-dicarboxylate transport system permease small subunit